jgi:type VI secretion system protein ImpC
LKIFILDVSKDELAGDLKSSGDLSDSFAYRLIVETDPGEPWALICGDYAFAPNVDDAAAMVRIAKLAAASKAPFVSHMRPDIFGVHSLAENPDHRNWEMSTSFDAGTLWATLRGLPEAKYLGMTMPRFLARLPYGSDTEPLETFSFEEFSGEPIHDGYLWTNGCFLVATLLSQSYSSFGWEMGRSMVQDVEDLPLHMYKQGTETVYQPCAEIQLSQTACDLLMNYGLMPLVSYKNTDRIKLARFQSITEPVTGLGGRWSR